MKARNVIGLATHKDSESLRLAGNCASAAMKGMRVVLSRRLESITSINIGHCRWRSCSIFDETACRIDELARLRDFGPMEWVTAPKMAVTSADPNQASGHRRLTPPGGPPL